MELFDFFYKSLEELKARTSFNQWEKLNEMDNAKEEIKKIIDFMVEECNRPPYNVVEPIVKMRVIHRAIVEDPEFTGLNAKFVAKTLGAWWKVNGDRVMEKMNQHTFEPPKPLTPEQKKEVDRMLNEYMQKILSGDGLQTVPTMEYKEAKSRGKEWTSHLEHRVGPYNNGITEQEYLIRRAIQAEGGIFYKSRHSLNLREFFVDGFRVMAEFKEDAEKIFENAKNRMKS